MTPADLATIEKAVDQTIDGGADPDAVAVSLMGLAVGILLGSKSIPVVLQTFDSVVDRLGPAAMSAQHG